MAKISVIFVWLSLEMSPVNGKLFSSSITTLMRCNLSLSVSSLKISVSRLYMLARIGKQ